MRQLEGYFAKDLLAAQGNSLDEAVRALQRAGPARVRARLAQE
jgi:hypothetical protein